MIAFRTSWIVITSRFGFEHCFGTKSISAGFFVPKPSAIAQSNIDLQAVCYWKSPRAIHHIRANSAALIRSATRAAFMTRSEWLRLEHPTRLKGVSLPMASARLMLIDATRYGVPDIRVWQLLYEL